MIFNEATLHGTLPWRNEQHETRRLLYRYCPEHVNFHGGTFAFEQPAWTRCGGRCVLFGGSFD
eukprot:SAG25_NODE_230_length_11432_cov_34.362481_8_plen_63_part_00